MGVGDRVGDRIFCHKLPFNGKKHLKINGKLFSWEGVIKFIVRYQLHAKTLKLQLLETFLLHAQIFGTMRYVK